MNRLEDLRLTKVALCGQGMNPEADILLFKAMADHPYTPGVDGMCADCGQPEAQHSKADEPPMKKEAAKVADDIAKTLEDVTGERDALAAELDALKALAPEDVAALLGLELAKSESDDDVLKGVPEAVRVRLEKAEKDAADQAARIAKMESERRVESFVRKARDEYGDLAPADELGKILETVEAHDVETFKALDGVLKAAAARIDKSALFAEAGASGGEADPIVKARVRAEEIRKENPAVDEVEALRQAMAETPEAAQAAFTRK